MLGQKKIQPTKKESFGVGTFFLNLFLAGTDAEKNQFTKVFSIESDPNKKSEKWKTWKTFGNDLFSAFTIQFIQAVIVFLFSQSSATEYYTAAFVKWFERRLEKPQRKYEKPQTKDDNEEGYVNESEERKYGNNQLEIEDMDMKMDEISPTRRKSPNRRHAWIQKKKSESEFMTDIKSVS